MVSLDQFYTWITQNHNEMVATKTSTADGSPFILAWMSTSLGHSKLRYLPTFYLVVECQNINLRIKAVTFKGQDVKSFMPKVLTSEEEGEEIVAKFRELKLCEGVKSPDDDMRFNSETFSRIYAVDNLDDNPAVLRSQSCELGLQTGQHVCKGCERLNSPPIAEDCKPSLTKSEVETDPPSPEDVALEDPFLDSDFSKSKAEESNEIARKVRKKRQARSPTHQQLQWKRTCNVCLVEFHDGETFEADQKLHEVSRKVNEAVQCPSCFITVLKVELNHHFGHDHPELEAGCCLVCLNIFSPKQKVSSHHHRTHSGSQTKLCPICGKSASDLKGHLDRIHSKSKKVMCPVCGKEFSSKHVLDRHLYYVHDSETKYKCKFCAQGFKRSHELRIHYWSLHLKVKPYRCKHCSFAVTQPQKIYEHCRNIHKLKGDKDDVERLEEEFERIKEFERQHGICRKAVNVARDQTKKRCWICQEYFEKKENLQIHELDHLQLKPFPCPFKCGLAFKLEKYLKKHVSGIHGDSVPPANKTTSFDTLLLFRKLKQVSSKKLLAIEPYRKAAGNQSVCSVCQASHGTIGHFYDHFLQHHGKQLECLNDWTVQNCQERSQEVKVCKCCGLETMSQEVLYRHAQEVHHLHQLDYDAYVSPPVVELEPKIYRPRQFRCRHCLTYTAVKKFTVLRHIKKTHGIPEPTDNDLLAITDKETMNLS